MPRLHTTSFAAAILMIAASPVMGQSILEQLERAIGGATTPPPAEVQAERGYLGLLAEENERGQIIVIEVDDNGPADRAGLQRGDRIMSIGDRNVGDLDTMAAILDPLRVGQEIAIKYARREAVRTANVKLGPQASALEIVEGRLDEIPPPPPEPIGRAFLGVRTEPVSPVLRERYSLLIDRGAVVTEVTRGSPADAAGIKVGSAIVDFAGQRIDDPKDLASVVRGLPAAGNVDISYYRGRQLLRTQVALGARQPEQPLRLEGGDLEAPPPPEPLPGEGIFNDLPRFDGDRPAGRILNRVLQGVREAEAPPPPRANPPVEQRVEMLERYIGRLERRIAELEAKLEALD